MAVYDIIIPTHDGEEHTLRCLEAIKENTVNYKIIWVDNGSTRSSRHKVIEKLRDMPYTCSWLETNEGFVKAVNHGITLGNSPLVIILHNDAVVTRGWLERLEYPLKRELLAVGSGSMSSDPEHWQGWPKVKSELFPDMPDFDVKDPSIASMLAEDRFKYQYKQVSSLSFFCVMLKRMIFAKHGFLDEEFEKGMLADEAFCSKIMANGGKLVFCMSSFVFHQEGTTYKRLYNHGDLRKAEERNKLLFERKYSNADK